MGLGSTTFLDALAALAVAALGTAAAAGSAAFCPLPVDAPRLPRKFWNLALYCSNGLSAADASSGSASRAVVEKRILTGCGWKVDGRWLRTGDGKRKGGEGT